MISSPMKGQGAYYIRIDMGGDGFDSTVSKLFSVGFVFGNDRYRTLEEIHNNWSSYRAWDILSIGEQECRAMIHARVSRHSKGLSFTSLDDVLVMVALDLY